LFKMKCAAQCCTISSLRMCPWWLQFDGVCRRSAERAKMNTLSGWFTVLPVIQDHYDLTAQEFHDVLALCYRKLSYMARYE